MPSVAYDPGIEGACGIEGVWRAVWPQRIGEADFIIFTCALNARNRHMLDKQVLAQTKPGVFVVNVASGPLIHEDALVAMLKSRHVHAAALVVFEEAPLPGGSTIRNLPLCIHGYNKGSNTKAEVRRPRHEAIEKPITFLY